MAASERPEDASSLDSPEGLGSSAKSPVPDQETLASLAEHLDRFADQLPEDQRRVLTTMLQAVHRDPALAALASEPAHSMLKAEEIPIFEGLLRAPAPEGRGMRPSMVMVMKATRRCNLRCTYCHFWSNEGNQTMSFEVLARAIHGVLAAPGVRSVEFVWHGGETTLLPIDFYRKALWLQQRFTRPGQKIANAVQTNGTILTPQWLDFFERYQFSVGVSLDGPPEIHDRRRFDAAGRPTSERVRRSLDQLRERGIAHGVLMVVDGDVVELGAERLLDYFLEIGVDKVALLNVIPENAPSDSESAGNYFEWPRFVEFLQQIFHLWWPRYKDRISFREVSDLMRRLEGAKGGICIYNGNCMGGFLTVEPQGEISACDKFIGDSDYLFGNLLEMELADLPASPVLGRAHQVTAEGIDQASSCRWFGICNGGCPHDRYLRARDRGAHEESCCGLAPLLSDMAQAIGRTSPSHQPPED